jgi:hypothetical protein
MHPSPTQEACLCFLVEMKLVSVCEEGAGERGCSHGVVVLVRADGSEVELDLRTPRCDADVMACFGSDDLRGIASYLDEISSSVEEFDRRA